MKNDETKRLGQWGEALAANYLYTRGWEIVLHHFAVRGGEIDLLARKGETLAVVEVKLRSGDWYPAGEAVTPHKRRCLRHAMDAYLMDHPDCFNCNIRFDICQISAPAGMETAEPVIDYFENAFYAP